MSSITIHDLPPSTHQALRRRAALNGRTEEAEVRHLIEQALQELVPGLDEALAEIGQRFGIQAADWPEPDAPPPRAAVFE